MVRFSADELYDVVAAYSGFGNHHTGTAVDRRTTAWLSDLLVGLGAGVHEERFAFDRYICHAELRAGGQVVPSLPIFYSAVGEWQTQDCVVVDVDEAVVGNPLALDTYLNTNGEAAALILAIGGPDDLPVQCNRVPVVTGDRPAVVIPRNWAARVGLSAELTFSGTLEPGHSANVVAMFGPAGAPAVNITTPLTGWTPAAGERGTGLAVALAMAADLSTDHRVTFSACSGHEIDHIGLRHHLASRTVTDEPVIHLGASVGSIDQGSNGPAELGDRRVALTTVTGELRDEIGRLVPAANWRLIDVSPWPGEGGTWFAAGASVLSFLGGSSLFHTEADTLDATTPEAMALAAEVAIDAARLFLSVQP